MLYTKRTTGSAIASLVLTLLGWLAGLPLLLINYQSISGRTAGVGVVGPFLLGILSAVLCFLGVLFGVVALAKISRGEVRGLGIALVGVILGSSVLGAYVLVAFLASGGQYLLGDFL